LGQAVTSLGDDGWQHEGPTSISEDSDVETLAAASILARFFGVLLAITQSIVDDECYGRSCYVQEISTITQLLIARSVRGADLCLPVGKVGRLARRNGKQHRKLGVG